MLFYRQVGLATAVGGVQKVASVPRSSIGIWARSLRICRRGRGRRQWSTGLGVSPRWVEEGNATDRKLPLGLP